jgi:hypothetical protein
VIDDAGFGAMLGLGGKACEPIDAEHDRRGTRTARVLLGVVMVKPYTKWISSKEP